MNSNRLHGQYPHSHQKTERPEDRSNEPQIDGEAAAPKQRVVVLEVSEILKQIGLSSDQWSR